MKRLYAALRIDRQLLLQFALVFAAFFIVVLISSVFGATIVNKNVAATGNEIVNSASETIKAYMDEYMLTLGDISFAIETLKAQNASYTEMEDEAAAWTSWIMGSSDRFESFNGSYGVVDGMYIDGSRWVPQDDYVPQSRPWYIGAVEKGGGVFFTDPYIDAQTGEFVFTVSQLVYDAGGKPFGVIALDVFINNLSDYVDEMRLIDSGYGVLLNSNREFVVTPDSSLIGQRFDDQNGGIGGYAEMGALMAAGEKISAYEYTDADGEKRVAFFTMLPNGWYVGMISPTSAYNSDVNTMVTLLSAVGFVMMVVLCVMLAFLHIEKARSDEANRIKTSFLANMSHEIRTPMNAIIGMTELLLNEPLNDRQTGYVNDINISSHSLLSIINDILDLSKIESGKLELTPIDYDFQIFIDNISSMFRFVAQKKELDFQFEKHGDIPRCVFGDDIRLRQVLTNICGNAVKFTASGYVRLTVTATPETLEFEIKDTGMGIRKEDLAKLFNPFEQADAQKNRNIVGTGLGLAISKTFVELMGGKIDVDSVYGQGTAFLVTIPRVAGDPGKVTHLCNKEKTNTFIAPDVTVLVVDDNPVNLKVASGLLNLFKINVQTASCGKDAIDMVKHNRYDVVFMDHMMPEMDGLETTCEIRKMGGEFRHLKIIALTANAIFGAKEMFMSHGFNGLITKPIDIGELTELLGGLLPPEKIVASAGAEHLPQPSSAFIDSLKDISRINTGIAMKRVSGMEDMYRETLETFHRRMLSEGDKMDTFLKDSDLHNFSILIHGIKSSLSTVGVMEMSDTAAKLEDASKDGQLEYCRMQFPAFLDELRSLHGELVPVFAALTQERETVKTGGDPALLIQKLADALTAAEDFDSTAGCEALDALIEFDYGPDVNKTLEGARDALKDFDYDSAINLLSALKQR